MAFISVNLPAPAGPGPGAAVDMTGFGSVKTITVQGNGFVQGSPNVTIEISNDAGAVDWAPLWTFQPPQGEQTFAVACKWMRANVSNYKGGVAPVVEVGGDDAGTIMLQVPVPVGNGIGADVSAASLALFKTVQIGGPFAGAIVIQISEDNGVTWSEAFGFPAPGMQSDTIAFNRVRVTRNGVPAGDLSAPICNIAAAAPPGGANGKITIENQGVVVGAFTIVNFNGGGVTASDAGAGVASVAIPASGWAPGAGGGSLIQNNGTGNTATGNDAIAIGSGSTAGGTAAFAQGSSLTAANLAVALNESAANGAASLASGGSTANGAFDVALGNGCVSTGVGNGAFSAGNGCGALADSTFAIGNGASANAPSSGALNEGFVRAGAIAALCANLALVEAGGIQAVALNIGAAASKNSVAIGEGSRTIRESQFSHASGRTTANGDKQTSWIELSGTTPGLAPNEAVELKYGSANDQVFSLEDGKTYRVEIDLAAGGVQAGPVRVSRSILIKFNARRDGGVSTITASGIGEGFGDAATNDWTLVATVGVGPDRIVVTFTTGATPSKCTVCAKLEFTEVAYS